MKMGDEHIKEIVIHLFIIFVYLLFRVGIKKKKKHLGTGVGGRVVT